MNAIPLTRDTQLGFRMSSLRISAAMRLEYMKCLFRQPISTLDALPPGQTAAIITITASVLQAGISEKLAQLLQSISLVVSALVIAFIHSWNLTLVTSCGLVFIVGVYASTTPFLVKLLGQVQHADIQASVVANETFNSIRMVAACGAEAKMEKRYAGWVNESRRRGMKMPRLIALQQAPGKLPPSPLPGRPLGKRFGLGSDVACSVFCHLRVCLHAIHIAE